MPTILLQRYIQAYPSRNDEVASCIIINNKQIHRKSEDLKLPQEFQHFYQLIEDNIEDMYVDKQMRKDASQYLPVTIQSLSMAVIIQKKNTRTELAQHLHA